MLAFDTSCDQYPFILVTLEISDILFQAIPSLSHLIDLFTFWTFHLDEGRFSRKELLPTVDTWNIQARNLRKSCKPLELY